MLSACDRRRRPARRQLPPRPLRCTLRLQHVQPQVDCGLTVRQHNLLRQQARSYCLVRSGEIFGRIAVDKLLTLIVDCQRLANPCDTASQVNDRVTSQIDRALTSQVDRAVTSEVNDRVRSQVDRAVTPHINGAVTSQVNGAMPSQVNGPVTSQVDGPVTSQVNGPVTSQVNGAVTSQVNGAVTSQVNGAVTSQVEDDVTSQVEQISSHSLPPYLLLDVRDRQLFERGHIATARHFSPRRLSRSVCCDTAALRAYRNRAHSIIVIYDDAETEATRCATVLTQRGYDNVFVLSGGLRLALDLVPADQLMVGGDGGERGGGEQGHDTVRRNSADETDYETNQLLAEQQLLQLEASLRRLSLQTASGGSLTSVATQRRQTARHTKLTSVRQTDGRASRPGSSSISCATVSVTSASPSIADSRRSSARKPAWR